MDVRREMFVAAVRLALVLSVGAILLAVAMLSVGGLSTPRFVSAVALVGFVTSWMVTGRVERQAQVVSRG
jgi:hypothetical protein